jgi:hypothetical protein
MTIYEDLIAAGIECRNYHSDLYFPVTPESKAILAKYPKHKPEVFQCRVTGRMTYDLFGQYDPYWLDVTQKEKTASLMLQRMVRQEGFEFPDACAKAAMSYGISSDRLREIYDQEFAQ